MDINPRMETQMDNRMENRMETGVIGKLYRVASIQVGTICKEILQSSRNTDLMTFF